MPSSLKTKRASRASSSSRSPANQSDSDEEPEEVQASAEELAVLRAAFEKQYGAGSAEGGSGNVNNEQEPEEDEKARKRRKIREKRAKARAALENSQSQQKLDTSVLQRLDQSALQGQTIIIGEGDGNDDDSDNEDSAGAGAGDNGGNGFHINKNVRSSVRLVEGNMEVHILGNTTSKDIISSFVAPNALDGSFVKPPPSLLEDRKRVPFHAFSKQKKGGPAHVFAQTLKQEGAKKKKAKKAANV